MKDHKILTILRNPYGFTDSEKKKAYLAAANRIENLVFIYENMKTWGLDNGLDMIPKQKDLDDD